MTPQFEAIAMLNLMFESHDGRPVDNAVLTRKDYAFLVEVLAAATNQNVHQGSADSGTLERDRRAAGWKCKAHFAIAVRDGRGSQRRATK